MGNDLRARVQTLARPRRGRIGVSDRWDSSGGTARDNYLSCSPLHSPLHFAHVPQMATPPSSVKNSRRLMRAKSGGPGGAELGMQILKFQVPSSPSSAREFRACDHILDTYPAKTSAESATADFTIPTSSSVFWCDDFSPQRKVKASNWR